jgi:hypothetical protein
MNHLIYIFLSLFIISSCEKKEEVLIRAPLDQVWDYVGNSNNAAEWSVYFHHITNISGEDGKPGALRRCFRRQDEQGNKWDEKTLEIVPKTYRKIHTHSLYGFPDEAFNSAEFHVHQRFVESPDGKSVRLSFGSELIKPTDIISAVRFIWYAREAKRVIHMNLENIKEAVESRHEGRSYQRPHPYEEAHEWDLKKI